eukprot:12978013-Alexandrium_andersonii.AAC.1
MACGRGLAHNTRTHPHLRPLPLSPRGGGEPCRLAVERIRPNIWVGSASRESTHPSVRGMLAVFRWRTRAQWRSKTQHV